MIVLHFKFRRDNMPVSLDNERIYVTVSKDMAAQIDNFRGQMGMTRSAFCSFLIGQGVMSMSKAVGLIDAIGDKLTDEAVEEYKTKKRRSRAVSDAVQLKMTSCSDCANPCKDDSVPDELAFCEHFRAAKK